MNNRFLFVIQNLTKTLRIEFSFPLDKNVN